MERTDTELTLEELLPKLEREHDAEADLEVRDRIWRLISSAEEYLLARHDQRRTQ